MGNNQGSPEKMSPQKHEEVIIKCEIRDIVKQFFKDFVIVWHDPNIDSPDNKPFIAQLENLYQVKTFTQFQAALDYVKQTKETCHFITPTEAHIGELCLAPNVLGVYTLGKIQDDLLKKNLKILHVEANLHKLLFKVEQNLMKNYEEKASSRFSFAPIFNEKDKRKLNTLHMYLTVIPAFRDRSQARTDFLTLCKLLYSDEKSFDFIINLTQNYEKQNVLNWYTQQSLLPRVIDTCLRISSSDSLQYCRLPIQDMQKAIHDQYQKQSRYFSGVLYRAAYLTSEEWNNLKENPSKDIETLGFFSTSKDPRIAINSMQIDPNQKVFITILVPKGPAEEERGFAEVDFEQQVIFNTMSRFTVLEAMEHFSPDLPYRHLALLYGAQSLRKYLAEQNPNPIQTPSLENNEQISCDVCKGNVLQKSPKFFLKSFSGYSNYCQECLDSIPPTNKPPLFCVPASNNNNETTKKEIKGCTLTYPPNLKIPLYGYKCCYCQKNHHTTSYFKCTECHQVWCPNCTENFESCMKAGHVLIFERNPLSFWQEALSETELKEELAQKESMPTKQVDMFKKTHEYSKAEEYFNKCLEMTSENNHDQQGYYYGNLGTLYFEQNNYQKTVEALLKASQYSQEDTYNLRLCYLNLSIGYFTLGDYKAAAYYCLQSINLIKTKTEEDRDHLINCYVQLGRVYKSQGYYKTAFDSYLKAFEASKEDSLDRPHYENSLGGIYQLSGQYDKALEVHSRVLEKLRSTHAENSIHLEGSYYYLAKVSYYKGEYSKALEYCLKGVEIVREARGENHFFLGSSYRLLGKIYEKKGECNQALEYHLKNLEILKGISENNHPGMGECYCDLGNVYNNLGEHTKALEYQFQALQITEKAFEDINKNHPNLAECWSGLGRVYCSKKDYKTALYHHLKSLNIRKTMQGENHPDVAVCYVDMGDAYKGEEDDEKAKEYYMKALEIRRSMLGEGHSDTISLQEKLASITKLKEDPREDQKEENQKIDQEEEKQEEDQREDQSENQKQDQQEEQTKEQTEDQTEEQREENGKVDQEKDQQEEQSEEQSQIQKEDQSVDQREENQKETEA